MILFAMAVDDQTGWRTNTRGTSCPVEQCLFKPYIAVNFCPERDLVTPFQVKSQDWSSKQPAHTVRKMRY